MWNDLGLESHIGHLGGKAIYSKDSQDCSVFWGSTGGIILVIPLIYIHYAAAL